MDAPLTRPTLQESLAFAIRACQLAGTLALAASIIFFVAANWQHFPTLTRFAIVEAPLLAALAFAFWKGPQHLSGQLALLLAILYAGALLALLGQTYQSGADVYELFALWALLSLPLAVAARYAPAWALWAIIANTAILLYPNNRLPLAPAFYANLAALAVTEALHRHPNFFPNSGLTPSWLRRALLAACLAAGSIFTILWIFHPAPATYNGRYLDLVAFYAACAAIAIYTWQRKEDIFPLALLGLSLIAISTSYLGNLIGGKEFVYFLFYAIYILVASTLLVRAIQRVRQQWAPSPTNAPDQTDTQAPPWFLQAVIGLCAWVAGLLLLCFVYLLLDDMFKLRAKAFLPIGIAAAAIAILLLRQSKPAALFLPQFALALTFAAQVSFAFGLDDLNRNKQILNWGMIAFELLLFFFLNSSIQRFLSVVLVSICWGFSLRLLLVQHSFPDFWIQLLYAPTVWLLILAPLAYAAYWLTRQESRGLAYPLATRFPALIAPLSHGLLAALCLAPLTQFPNAYGLRSDWTALWSLYATFLALFALGLAFYRQNRPLLGLAILAALLEVAYFYYALGVPLLSKAALMALLGIALLLTANYLQRRKPA
jgi:uncharacterized membrane protein